MGTGGLYVPLFLVLLSLLPRRGGGQGLTGRSVLGVSIFRLVLTFQYFDENDFLHWYGISYLWLYVSPYCPFFQPGHS